ncbi:TetR/AcrR family transcriptional regulator [Nocardia brasiliensis]|uniref:TetR/AcrR family transcriptional regulator n=1 Tax=Nocardia brasiliensis TaxID=37326 RepID=UPI0037AF831B
MPKGMTAKGEATRARLVAGAAEVVMARGISDVTLDDVCARTGTSKSQLFHYFPGGKEELFVAVAQQEAERVLDGVAARMNPLTSWAAWEQWRAQLLGEFDSRGGDCPLQVLVNQIAPASEGARAVVVELIARWQAHLRAGIEHMQAGGELDTGIDADRMASAILSAVHGGVVMMMLGRTREPLEAAMDMALSYLRSAAARP